MSSQKTSYPARRKLVAMKSVHVFFLLAIVVQLSTLNFLTRERMLTSEQRQGDIKAKGRKRKLNKNNKWTLASFLSETVFRTTTRKASRRCKHRRQKKRHRGNPIWIPAYPGSGSELVRRVVAALTGLEGAEIYRGSGCKSARTVTCKTHWPVLKKHNPHKFQVSFDSSVILLIRNPAEAIPSYVNHRYEESSKLKYHSTQAPQEEWIRFRDSWFDTMLQEWKNVTLAWHASPVYNVTMYLAYERLVDEAKGPGVVNALAKELQRVNVKKVLSDDNNECLWRNVVQKGRSTKRTEHTYVPAYTTRQQTSMLQVMDELAREIIAPNKALLDILAGYKRHIQSNLRIQDERESHSPRLGVS